MKKYINGKTAIATAMLAALLTILVIIPLSAGAGDNPGEGAIPIPEGYDIKSSGESTDNPEELEAGQIWVNKNVYDNEDGTFEITLYIRGEVYSDDEGGILPPLEPDNSYVTIADTIGEWFEFNDDAVFDVGDFSVDDEGEAVWIVSQDDILDGVRSCVFTVTLKEGWVTETPYYTNKGAAAAFKPQKGNPYYWNEPVAVPYQEFSNINWNNGEGTVNGINAITIRDFILGLTLVKTQPSGDIFRVTDYDGYERVFEFDGSRTTGAFIAEYDEDGDVTNFPDYLSTAEDQTWGALWNKGGQAAKTYFIWFKGLTDPEKLTMYVVSPGNNGGNNNDDTTLWYYTDYTRKENDGWQEDGSIVSDLPNWGVIELSCVTIVVYKEITGDAFTGARPVFEFGLYDNAECTGDPVAVAKLASNDEGMRAVFQFGFSVIADYFAENEESAVFWIKEIAGTVTVSGGRWTYDTQIVEVIIGIDGIAVFYAEIEEGEDYPVFTNSFRKSDPEPTPSQPTPTDTGDTYEPVVRTSPVVTQESQAPAPPAEPPVDIIDDAPPLADMPVVETIPDDGGDIELVDDAVPLGDMPQTGIESMVSLWLFGICASMLAAGLLIRVIYRVGRKGK